MYTEPLEQLNPLEQCQALCDWSLVVGNLCNSSFLTTAAMYMEEAARHQAVFIARVGQRL